MFTRRVLLGLALSAIATWPQPRPAPARPKLVVGIVIDQFRYDYLTRFRSDYTGGLARLLNQGAVFTNARYIHYPTVTAVGHATFMTGATPSLSGIINNEWYDRATARQVTSVGDPAVKLLGGREGPGASPRRLLVSTLGDELKRATRGKARVIGISLKDRAAILPAGHMADGAYWFDTQTGNFVSSTFYFADLPGWVKDFNRSRLPDKYVNAEWTPLAPNAEYPAFSKRMPGQAGPPFYAALEGSPYGNELVESLAERAIDAEQLGRRAVTDLLTVSFSANDFVGHEVGPDAPQVRDMALRVDRALGKLLDHLERRIGPGGVLVVLTADHGVAPVPEVLEHQKMPGGRYPGRSVPDAIQAALVQRYGEGRWLVGWSGPSPYLSRELMRDRKLRPAEVEHTAAEAVAALPHIFRVYTREDLLAGRVIDDSLSRQITNALYPSRSPDLLIVAEPYWIDDGHGTTHGSPFAYDTHVPVIFLGPNVRPGRYDQTIAPNDVAPTLATMLDLETPSGATGRVLTEMLVRP